MLLTECLLVCPLCAQMMLQNGCRRAVVRKARRAAGRPGVRGRGPQRLREVCQAVPWCTFLCMDCAGGRCGRGWRGERPSRDLRERASHRAAAKRACCERRIVGTQELLAALPSCTWSACRAHADTCTFVTVRDRGARARASACTTSGCLGSRSSQELFAHLEREQPVHTVVRSARGQLCVGAAAVRCLPGPVALCVQWRRTRLGYIREGGNG